MKHPEILAPAGSFDSLIAAVQCGANAVYLGGKGMNARRNAGNFDAEELRRAVEYCHLRGVKVYQTINIVMFEDEIDEAVETIRTAAEAGVDAVLTQDLAVARMVRECAPTLPVHASTQMSIHNLEGARLCEELGFSRVVLARELTAAEIRHICENTPLEVEVFVHGALCMSVSGQCYLSSMIGGRSGNRGLCAQPCRLPFQAEGGKPYALSLKDLSLADRIAELTEMGVASLKIEGRMKRPEYVAAAVSAIRTACEGRPVDFETLRSVFSRSGFTKGYFDGRIDREMFGYRQKEDVTSAAGVLGELARLYDRENPLVPVSMRLEARAAQPTRLTVSDRDGHTFTVEGSVPQTAINKPTTPERAAQNLGKTGGTPFYADEMDCDLDDGLMIPASELNALRREALEQLTAARSDVRSHAFTDRAQRAFPRTRDRKIPTLRARLRLSQLTPDIAARCPDLILPYEDIAEAVASGKAKPEQLIVEIPRLLFEGTDAVLEVLRQARKLGVTRAWCGNLGAIDMARNAGLSPVGGYSLNITNSAAVQEYAALGLADTELSFELPVTRARSLGGFLPQGILAYGYLPLMALRNCPIKAAIGCGKCRGYESLTDRKGVRFTVDCGRHDGHPRQVSELYNSVPLWLADRLGELEGLSFLTLWFTRESAAQCEAVVQSYAEGRPMPGAPSEKTRGLYYRTVL